MCVGVCVWYVDICGVYVCVWGVDVYLDFGYLQREGRSKILIPTGGKGYQRKNLETGIQL